MVEVERGRDRCRCGIMLFCSSYPRVVFSLIELEYREAESNQYYRMEIVGVRELEMGTWDLCQDRDFYSPRKTQLLESNADMLDIILEGYSVDDNALSQVFHGLSGLTALSLQRPRLDASGQGDGSGCLVTPPSTSRHCIFLRDSAGSSRDPKDSMEAGLMFLSLNTCGRLTCKYVYVYQGEEGDVETVRRLLYERVFGGELSGVYLSRGMKESLGELYQFILRDEEGLSGGLRRVSRFPQILRPGAGGMSGTDLACSQGSRGAGVGEGMNEELEVANEQLTRRQYYNSRVFSGLDLVSLLLGADGSEDLDFDGETETPVLDHASFVSVRSGDSENAQSVHGGRRCGSGGRFQVHSEDGEWSMEEIMSESRRMSLPLTLTNGFDYQKEFRGLPRALWTEDSVLSRRLSGECVHIPSLDAQPFPLCSCRYLEEASGEGLESSGDEDCYAGSSVMLQEGANRRSTPVFDVVGAKNYEFNSTLEEYLSFVQEDFPERSSGEGGGVYVLNDTLRQLSESINELPLTPVSERMAENYLKYNRYLGGRLNDERLFKKKWRVSQSCSRMKQPGCLLKYLAINELEVRRADEREEALRRLDADEGSESETRALSEDELERMFQEEMENDDREDDDEEEENDDREDDDEEDGEENDDREDDDEEDGEEEEKRGRSGRRRGDVLPRRGVLISKRLISTLKVFWDESCDFYGLNSVGGLGEEGEERRETLDLLEDDLSQWHDYPYVSFGSVDARIEEKENLRLSLMSYVDTQLSSL
ncbi:hypothetical protein OJ253_3046 [Cryptosporidium canis]|uniref:Uncharacterized protein n=1 Tax=Cryptosporidium canis TaxID=195482 RepID=A0A9D5HWI4_9CRYT|nr:hypothetical protein OJ253_3046 [Cryptosporidium canis]